MKFGFVSAIFPDLSFEEVIDFAAAEGFSRVELCAWPKGTAERRYAGVTHLDADAEEGEIERRMGYAAERGVGISSLAYYPNPLDPDPEKAAFFVSHLEKLIRLSGRLGIGTVTTFVGRDRAKTAEDNFAAFLKTWRPLVALAESSGVRVAIENCPMLFTDDEWPGGLNLATSPAVWRRMFASIPSPAFGLNYDPSHFVWQRMDYLKPIAEFADRIFHVHFKDVKLYTDKLDEVGIMATPLQYMAPKLPGLGDVAWGPFVSALMDIGYDGAACIEVEDRAFESTLEDRKKAVRLSGKYLRNYLGD